MAMPELTRRGFCHLSLGAALAACQTGAPAARRHDLPTAFAALEGRGRLGAAVLDTGTSTVTGHRLDERFAMCSTFKLLLAAAVMERAALGARSLDATVAVTEADLLRHAPVTGPLVEAAVARGERRVAVSIATLAHGAQTTSDNPAANVLLRDLGGPSALTAFCRSHGDHATRLDRYEPEMNDVGPGDPRDTTTPRAMARLVAHLLGERGLPASARARLRAWMIETSTGTARVRAGLPADWVAGDKTGTGGSVADGIAVKVNDVVWIEPPHRAPLVVAAYYDTGAVAEWPTEAEEAVLAEVGRLVAAWA